MPLHSLRLWKKLQDAGLLMEFTRDDGLPFLWLTYRVNGPWSSQERRHGSKEDQLALKRRYGWCWYLENMHRQHNKLPAFSSRHVGSESSWGRNALRFLELNINSHEQLHKHTFFTLLFNGEEDKGGAQSTSHSTPRKLHLLRWFRNYSWLHAEHAFIEEFSRDERLLIGKEEYGLITLRHERLQSLLRWQQAERW